MFWLLLAHDSLDAWVAPAMAVCSAGAVVGVGVMGVFDALQRWVEVGISW